MKMLRLENCHTMPSRATAGSAAFDLYATDDCIVSPHATQATVVGTGVAIDTGPGMCALVLPRSGLATRHGLRPANTPGLIDSDYRGEIKVALVCDGPYPVSIRRGDRIAQLLVVAHCTDACEVDSLDDTQRGAGGFGSSGV